MKIFLSMALGVASLVSVAAPSSLLAQTQPAQVTATATALETKLDTKIAKSGDVVSVRLMQEATVGGVKYPVGSHLLGKILNADKDKFILIFDSIQVKKADPVPVHAGLASIAPEYDANAGGMGGASEDGMPSGGSGGPGPLVMTTNGSSVKNVTLTPSKTTEFSGTLSSVKDFKLDKGTRFWFGLF